MGGAGSAVLFASLASGSGNEKSLRKNRWAFLYATPPHPKSLRLSSTPKARKSVPLWTATITSVATRALFA